MIVAKDPRTLLLALAIFAAVLVVGCGGSSSDPLTKAEFLKQANAICGTASSQRQKELKESASSDGEAGAAGLKQLVEMTLEPVESMAGELTALQAPPAQMKAAKAYAALVDQGIKQLEAKPAEAITGEAFKGANAAAKRAGLPACVI